MTAIRTIIIDDEPNAISVLEQLLAEIKEVSVVGSAISVNDGIELIQEQAPELVFLDVEMPHKNGFELFKAYPNPTFKVIFATAFDHYAINAIRHSALDYLVKPIDAIELKFAISRALKLQQTEDIRIGELYKMVEKKNAIDRIIIPSKKGFHCLLLDEICSIEAERGNYAFFTTVNGTKYLCSKPLTHYESILVNTSFFRIHRSCLVNLKHISQYDNKAGEVLLSNQFKYSIATRRQAAFNRKIRQL